MENRELDIIKLRERAERLAELIESDKDWVDSRWLSYETGMTDEEILREIVSMGWRRFIWQDWGMELGRHYRSTKTATKEEIENVMWPIDPETVLGIHYWSKNNE